VCRSKKKSLTETTFKLKVKNTNPEPPVENPQGGFDGLGNDEQGLTEPNNSSNEKPFDDQPFDAGVEADEDSDPKKYIQQLSGKLGQSLRKYTDETGNPDLELEKFAINSVISATHTSEMDENDKSDIINKINSSGKDDENLNEPNQDNNDSNGSDDSELSNSEDGEDGEEKNFGESLNLSENLRNLGKKNMSKISENFDCECGIDEIVEEIVGSTTVEPQVKPQVKPEIQPSRRSKPFRVPVILPEHAPKPKAITEGKIEIKPQNIWWENNPNELLNVTYWHKGQTPPSDIEKKKEAFINLIQQLDSKFPAPVGRKEKMLNMLS